MTRISQNVISGFREEDPGMLDIVETSLCEVIVDNDRLWVNIDGVCRLRVGRMADQSEVALTGSHKGLYRPPFRPREELKKED